MLEPVSRLYLWRFAIHLVHKTVKPAWEGPLYAAGYREFIVEASFYNKLGDRYSPDIAVVGVNDWAVLELTTSPKAKADRVEKYRTLSPEYLYADHSLSVPKGNRAPFPLVVRAHPKVPDGCPQIVIGDRLSVSGLDEITDPVLREKLADIDGIEVGPVPQSRLAFVPESTQREVRYGLVPSIKSMLWKPGASTTIHSLAEEGLDFLWPRASAPGRTQLMGKIREAMDALVTEGGGPLADYLQLGPAGYVSSSADVLHHRSVERVEEILSDWVRKSPPGRRTALPEFDGEESESAGHSTSS